MGDSLPERSVRAATIDDYDSLCALYLEADALHHEGSPDAFAPPAKPPRSRDYIESALSGGLSTILVSQDTDSGGVTGMVRLVIRPASSHPALMGHGVGWVEELVVLESHKRQGIGAALMSAAQRWFRDRGITETRLVVWEFNRDAIAFYERLSYKSLTRTMRLRQPDEDKT
jgi:ribosomal protein S18 acetylase RimI-like enzyme